MKRIALILLLMRTLPLLSDTLAEPLVTDTGLPHLRKHGAATQLMVDGKPFVMLAGELHDSSASSVDRPMILKVTVYRHD